MKKQVRDEDKKKIKESRKQTAFRRQSQQVKVYELKINKKRLNKRQKEELDMMFLEAKRFYNFVLDRKQKLSIPLNCINPTDFHQITYQDKDKNLIDYELRYLKSSMKQTIHSRMISNQKTIISLVKRGVQTHGNLKFKSELNCIPLKNIDWKFKSENKVWITGIKGKLLVRGTNQFNKDEVEFANANLIRKPDGYYLKITTYIDKEKIKQQKTNGKEIGLDFGIKANITTSEGEKIDVVVRESDRLKKLQREMFRRVKGSNNRYKTINRIQREYQKLSNQKRDKANKIVHMLKEYSCIAMQDEQIADWHKGWFGKQVQHSCLGLIKAKLKSLPQTIVLDKWIPTTKWCPNCGTINRHVTLADRVFRCGCSYESDRDIHSAKNMLAIKDLVFQKNQFVPTEHREITLMEFKAAADSESASLDEEVRRCSVFN